MENKLPKKNLGLLKIFTEKDERAFVSDIVLPCEFGFPVDELDFRFIVKACLANQGKIIRHYAIEIQFFHTYFIYLLNSVVLFSPMLY